LPLSREKKEAVVDEIKTQFEDASNWYASNYRGLTVTQIGELRRQLRSVGADLRVVKNSLGRIAIEKAGIGDAVQLLDGPTALTFCGDDPVGPAKALWNLFTDDETRVIYGGYVDGEVVGVDVVNRLAHIPSRDELLVEIVGSINGPVWGLVSSLESMIFSLVFTLESVQHKLGSEQTN